MSLLEKEPNQESASPPSSETHWERSVLEKVALASITEQRRSRRWGIFFKLLFFVYLFVFLVLAYDTGDWLEKESINNSASKHVALIKLQGLIASDMDASSDNINEALHSAFTDSKVAGIILKINSPGGSPVESAYIYDEIARLRKEHAKTPLYAVITDVCASGGYYVASAAERIYAAPASMVGSIGVLMDGFGFVGSLEKLGVERRLLTAGRHKGFLDPFSPTRPDEIAHTQSLLNDIHQQFITAVKTGRQDRLKKDEKIFSGLIWTGKESLALGLIDGLDTVQGVAKNVIGVETIVDYTARKDVWERFADRVGVEALQLGSRILTGSLY